MLAKGGATTLALSAAAAVLALTLGGLLGLLRISNRIWLATPARVLIDVVRGTPVLIQLYLIYFGLPSLGIFLSPFLAAVVALGVNAAAYVSEIVRAAIQSVPKQQTESCRALGLSRSRTFCRIIAPQALGIALPPLTNELIDIVKWSSIAAIVVVPEMTQVFYTIVSRTFQLIEVFVIVSAFYLIVTSIISALLGLLEVRLSRYRIAR